MRKESVSPAILASSLPRNVAKFVDQIKDPSLPPGCSYTLDKEPTKDNLQFCVENTELEIGVSHLARVWILVKGTPVIIPFPELIEKNSGILAHTHPKNHDYSGGLPYLPSSGDVILGNPQKSRKKEFIIHADGITYYTGINKDPVSGADLIPKDAKEAERIFRSFFRYSKEFLTHDKNGKIIFDLTYKELVLDLLGVIVINKEWQELTNKNPLSNFAKEV